MVETRSHLQREVDAVTGESTIVTRCLGLDEFVSQTYRVVAVLLSDFHKAERPREGHQPRTIGLCSSERACRFSGSLRERDPKEIVGRPV